MKSVYCFYIIKEEISPTEYPGIKMDTIIDCDDYQYSLYAFTPDFRIASLFMEMRDMDVFYKKILKLEKDEYNEFFEEYQDYLLEYHVFSTKIIENDNYVADSINLLCTKFESDNILFYSKNHIYDILNNDWNIQGEPGICDIKFNDKILGVLNEYFYYEDILSSCKDVSDENSGIQLDHLQLFIRLFSNTLNKEIEE